MKVAVGFDHRGVILRDAVFAAIAAAGCEALDLGVCDDAERVDYPDVALAVTTELREGRATRGVIVCGSGVGASVAACKVRGIRAAICHDVYSAHQGVEHDDLNVLCLGSGVVGAAVAHELVAAFLGARFLDEGRYRARLDKVERMEAMNDG